MSITYSQTGNVRRETESRFPAANFTARSAPSTSAQLAAVVIEPRLFIRDCLARALRSATGHEVVALASVEEWLRLCEHTPAAVLLLSGHGKGEGAQLSQMIRALSQAKRRVPTVILSDAEDIGQVVEALDQGVKGYIPTNLSLDVVVEAMRLVRAGGVFVPASCISTAQERAERPAVKTPLGAVFTARQEAVVDALRQGKANKTIAYELQLQESTVKVHIRNIMKKLKAKNRTAVAYIVSQMTNENRFSV
jgi:DNA-binding NarL/FixJ family response regulator